jgi:hypothetical protein
MKIVFIYVEDVVNDPDSIKGEVVPFVINDKEIFFGPCKKYLRQQLKKQYLPVGSINTNLTDEIYFVGINKFVSGKERKFVWVGKVKSAMTFQYAFEVLFGSQYTAMREHWFSPLLVRPIYDLNNNLSGYEKYKYLHRGIDKKDGKVEWQFDISSTTKKFLVANDDILHVNDCYFSRDICFLLENIHAADKPKKLGIKITPNVVKFLQEAQNDPTVTEMAPFGTRNNKKYGRHGGWLKLEDHEATDFLNLILPIE